MDVFLKKSKLNSQSKIIISGSKSESNRLLLLQALYSEIDIDNLSDSDDSVVMQNALKTTDTIIDIHHAGTAMRFLTAYFATQNKREVVLTGSQRMKERPIKILVDALTSLGANISYLENQGCPPLKITGSELTASKVTLKANVSSQYISALLLIAPSLKSGLELTLDGEITSVPYIKMTLALLNQVGIETTFEGQKISVKPMKEVEAKTLTVESDWSSASYFYSLIALSDLETQITISSYKKDSLQGDSVLEDIYKHFGVETTFNGHYITLKKVSNPSTQTAIQLDLANAPDIAQTISVTCFGLGIACYLTGLHTLKIKETDRLSALKIELEKLGAEVLITDNSLKLAKSNTIKSNVAIDTYNDHRMAMAFAPLALKTDLRVNDAAVVSKSYIAFWEHLKAVGIQISQ
ncbi:3-phosphoshikimate 1-carboxyvinyltransferase [Corallibacter sp.]|uniref:3-phosphoshikimate 1-carboxyvinyltransferase n=1 Tax=Corallibacter sp. TaxID=2038084 RepID=UPI003AB12CCA